MTNVCQPLTMKQQNSVNLECYAIWLNVDWSNDIHPLLTFIDITINQKIRFQSLWNTVEQVMFADENKIEKLTFTIILLRSYSKLTMVWFLFEKIDIFGNS